MEQKSTNITNPIIEINTMRNNDDLKMFLEYEIRSSVIAKNISWNWAQEILGKYFAWKVKVKYERYKSSKMWENRLKNYKKLK